MAPLDSPDAVTTDIPSEEEKDYTWVAVFIIPLVLVIFLFHSFLPKSVLCSPLLITWTIWLMVLKVSNLEKT